jgi:hypothetical protein
VRVDGLLQLGPNFGEVRCHFFYDGLVAGAVGRMRDR